MTGFFHDPDADPTAYLFGSGQLAAAPIQPDRDWRPWRPAPEIQNGNGFDPLSCASYGSLNLIEIYLHRVFGVKKNYSDRWLAYKTGTKEKGGNDPHYVLEYIRNHGIVEESAWPFTHIIRTYVDYYFPPDLALDEIAKDFNKDYKLQHDTVRGGIQAIWDALQYSPLGVSTGFTFTDPNGFYYKEEHQPDFHWCICDHADKDKFLSIYDTGEPSEKKATWDKFKPYLVKRISITKRLTDEEYSLLEVLAQKLRAALAWLMSQTPSEAVKPSVVKETPKADTSTISPSQPLNDAYSRVYDAAYSCLGKDLSKHAPDERGCAESVSRVLRLVYADFPILTSTIALNSHLAKSKRFKQVKLPSKGCVSIFPTQGAKIGHVGIFGNTHVMSNDSKTGLFSANYDFTSWYGAAKKRGLVLYHYLPL